MKKNKKFHISKLNIFLIVAAFAIVLCVCVYFIYINFHYKKYDKYKAYLSEYEYEKGTTYKSIDETVSSVKGFELVSESKYLKLYTKPDTADIAVFDKRDNSITYSNPQDADSDTIANKVNISFLKSQIILQYYNEEVNDGMLNSFDDCVSKGQFEAEGIENGIRYIYQIGNTLRAGTKYESIYFVVPLEYRLYDDYLEVSIPTGEIEEHGGGYVNKIQLLRYMGATDTKEEGYMVVPNGSGSLISFNNGKTKENAYNQYIYDIDPLAANYTTLENSDSARLPLFGICSEDRDVLVTIEDGASLALITSGVSGMVNNYNYTYTTFLLRNSDNLRMFGNSTGDVYIMEPDIYDVNCRIRYSFMDDEHKGYSGLANYYRDRLIDEEVLNKKEGADNIPLYMDVITGARENAHFCGVSYLNTFAMSTFDDVEDMSDYMLQEGIDNQVINLCGWFNKGYYHDAADSINVIDSLGGRSGLRKLREAVADNGGTLYGDAAIMSVTYADNGFKSNFEGSRYYSGYVAGFGLVSPTSLRSTASLGYIENRYYILSPKFLPRYVEKFSSKMEKVPVDGISLRDMGSMLASDKKRTNPVNREEALDVVKAELEVIGSGDKKIMTSSANDYSFGVSSDIINVSIKDNAYPIVDEQIPLYQMIIHGCISYSSNNLNDTNQNDMTNVMLKLVETGTAPHYMFTKEESSRMKLTALNKYYSTTFDKRKEECIEVYNYVNSALKHVDDANIVNHEIIDDVRVVSYDNGVKIYVNYGKTQNTVDGYVLKPQSYYVEGIDEED